MDGALVLILHTHLPYVMHHGKWPHGSDWLCEAAAECYIPILNECDRLLEEGIKPKLTISLSPVVVEQLADPDFPQLFNDWLDEKILATRNDEEYFSDRPEDGEFISLTEFWRTWFTARKRDFNDRYGCDIVAAFRRLAEGHAVALQTCAATHGYFPLLGRDRSVNAQIGIARQAHKRHFGETPRGIWMPECAYRPCYHWNAPIAPHLATQGLREGIEQIIAHHGMQYTVIDSHQTREGSALGMASYIGKRVTSSGGAYPQAPQSLPLNDSRSIYDIYQVCSTGNPDAGTTAVFSRDTETTFHVWSGDYGYPGSPHYLEFHKRHYNNGLRYWRVTDPNIDLAGKQRYRPEKVGADIRRHAEEFVNIVEWKLREFKRASGHEGTLTAPFDTELFGHWWFEGPRFLGEVLRILAGRDSVVLRTAPEELEHRDARMFIRIREGSWGDGGDHRVWFNRQTDWTWVSVYDIEDSFYELLDSRDTTNALETRLLMQMAREMLLQQASDWQFLITTKSAADYAIDRLIEHQNAALYLAECIRDARRDGDLSLEQYAELERLETTDRIFPELDLTVFQ